MFPYNTFTDAITSITTSHWTLEEGCFSGNDEQNKPTKETFNFRIKSVAHEHLILQQLYYFKDITKLNYIHTENYKSNDMIF